MELCTDLVIDDHFAIHVLDNRLPTAQCSQALTVLPDGLRATLENYLLSILKPAYRRKRFGRFQTTSPVLHEYQRLVQDTATRGRVDPVLFLEVSQRLATELFSSMRQAPQNGSRAQPGEITPGDLLVGLFYSRTPEASPVPVLFLIKIELESGFQRQMVPHDTGGMRMVLSPCEALLPRFTTQHVHKSALIQFRDDPTTYDVVMTDPQGGKHGIAQFFARDFLHTEPFQTPDEQAELLFMRAYNWVQKHAEALSPQEQNEALQSVRSHITEHAARAEPLAPRDLVATLPLTEPRAEQTARELRASFQETLTAPETNGDSIPPDRQLLIQTVPERVARTRVTYQLDDGVQLSGDQQAIERLFSNPPHRVENTTEFTIRTTTFRLVV